MLHSRNPQDLGGRGGGQEIKTHHQTLPLPTSRNKILLFLINPSMTLEFKFQLLPRKRGFLICSTL